jgi:hypothetical protein
MIDLAPRDHRETRVLDCPHCDGGFIYYEDGIDRFDGSVRERRHRCAHCNGSGKVEVEPQPMTLDEALELDAEILASQTEATK